MGGHNKNVLCPKALISVTSVSSWTSGTTAFQAVNNNNNNQRQCLWCCHRDHGHCESSPGSFDECRLSAGWPPTHRPSQPTWAVSPPINGCYHPHPPLPFVIITQPKADTHFTVPRRVEGWVDLGTAGRVHRSHLAVYLLISVKRTGLINFPVTL